jgi:hypothetical protein
MTVMHGIHNNKIKVQCVKVVISAIKLVINTL